MLFGWVLVVGVSLAIFLLMLGAEFWLVQGVVGIGGGLEFGI